MPHRWPQHLCSSFIVWLWQDTGAASCQQIQFTINCKSFYCDCQSGSWLAWHGKCMRECLPLVSTGRSGSQRLHDMNHSSKLSTKIRHNGAHWTKSLSNVASFHLQFVEDLSWCIIKFYHIIHFSVDGYKCIERFLSWWRCFEAFACKWHNTITHCHSLLCVSIYGKCHSSLLQTIDLFLHVPETASTTPPLAALNSDIFIQLDVLQNELPLL